MLFVFFPTPVPSALRRSGAKAIEPVLQAQERMLPEHARTGITHDDSGLLTALALIAVHGTVGAGWLGLAEAAALEPQVGVVQKLLAFGTQPARRLMMVAAVNADHRRHGFPLPRQPGAPEIVFASQCGSNRS